MFIDKKLAEEIEREVQGIIPFYFNIMDDTGTILTCSDASRIGTKHAGTFLMVDQNLNELIVERENMYEGCTMGMIFSIRFSSKIVGFIGVRGVPAEIVGYGRIIQKMTELLVHEKFEAFRQEIDDHARELLVHQLVTGTSSDHMFDAKKELAKKGMDSNGKFTVAVLRFLSHYFTENDKEIDETKRKIARRYVVNYLLSNGMLVSDNKDQCVVISNHSRSFLLQRLRELLQHIEIQYQMRVIGAISNEMENYTGIPEGFSQAVATIRFIKSRGIEGLHYYDPTNLDFIVKQLPEMHKETLYQQMFSECTEEEIQEFRSFIVAYVACNGSLKVLSERYYLHKNTIQYKIKRIHKKTGKDIRRHDELMILYIAIL
ncbi:sugar diacid recognition domain-containing protein [Anaerotignum sp.]